MQNPFIWYDLMTSDVEAAKSFYGNVVGWNFGLQPPAYHLLKVGDAAMGGIMAHPEETQKMPPFWSGYIMVDDVDAACAKTRKLGGTVCREPWDIPGVLRMAVIADPTGATFNIMKPVPQGDGSFPAEDAVGTVGWRELHAGDLDAAWNFYAQMFGWTKGVSMDMGAMGPYQIFQLGGQDTGGMMKKHEMMPQAAWVYYFRVDGIDAAAARIAQHGGTVTMGPHQVPGGQWIVMAMDPQGGMFALLSTAK